MNLFTELKFIFPRKQRLLFLVLFFLQLIGTTLDFFGISLVLPFVSVLLNESTKQASWYLWIYRVIHAKTDSDVLLVILFAIMGVYVFKNLYRLLLLNLNVRFVSQNRVRMGAKMIHCYMHRPYTFHLQRNTAEIIRNINGDISGSFSLISTLLSLISSILIVVALVVYLILIDVWMTLAISSALIVCSAIYFFVVRTRIKDTGKESRLYSAKMYKAIHQAMGGIKEVKVMGREKFFARVYEEAGANSVELGRKYSVLSSIPRMMIEVLCVCSVLGVIAARIVDGADLSSVVPSLSAFALAAVKLMPQANAINSAISSITFNRPSLDALYADMTEAEREAQEILAEAECKRKEHRVVEPGAEHDILLTNISFTYPNLDEPVLKNLSLRIRHGESVGIIGVTGAGKTTLVDIILGLLKPDCGSVCYGALDIHEDYAEWQKHIGYIPQNIYLVDDTIRNNVALGVEAECIDEDAVWAALESAQLADFVRGLKDGLDTVIGERGVRISGGQRQRIGIARALYYDPEILFFDEATSSLDNETEAAVMKSINAIGRGKTMIIVAHRLTTLKGCDTIFKVVDGGVEETSL